MIHGFAAGFLLLQQVLHQKCKTEAKVARPAHRKPPQPREPPPPEPPGAHVNSAMLAQTLGQPEEAVQQWIKENMR